MQPKNQDQVYLFKLLCFVYKLLQLLLFSLVKPKFNGHNKAAADVGSRATLSCIVWSFPPASSIHILKGDVQLENTDTITVADVDNVDGGYELRKTVTFSPVRISDYRSYTCRATNSLGVSEQEITLQLPGWLVWLLY